MKTITFYSYKGGVGRSLALANIASRLCEFKRNVCLLDFDLEAPGLHFKFPTPRNFKINNGIVDYIYEFTRYGKLPNSISKYLVPLTTQQGQSLHLISAGNTDSSDYWKKLSSINWHSLLYQNKNGIAFFLDLKEKIKLELNPDYLLIDSRTGISEMSGITLSLLADDVVVVAANNKENLNGARKIIQSITKAENSIFDKAPKVTFVLSRIPFTDKPEDKAKEQNLISKIQRDYFLGLVNDVNIIHSDRELEENEQIKIGYDRDGSTAQISKDYLNLFEKLTQGEFSAEEIKQFEDIKRSETLLVKAMSSKLMPERIDLITQAMQLNKTNLNFYYQRAIAYYVQRAYENAIEDLTKITAVTKYYPAIELLADVYMSMENYSEAQKIYKELLQSNPKNFIALMGVASTYSLLDKKQISLDYFNQAVEVNPESSVAWAGRGNAYRELGNYTAAIDNIFKSLELDANNAMALATMAEIQAALGDKKLFYLYIEMALKTDAETLERVIFKDKIYEKFRNDERFNKILERYNVVFPVN